MKRKLDPRLRQIGRAVAWSIAMAVQACALLALTVMFWPILADLDPLVPYTLAFAAALFLLGHAIKVAFVRRTPVSVDSTRTALTLDLRTPDELELCARHEAMHVVVAHHLGAAIVSANIKRAGRLGGATSTRYDDELPAQEQRWRRAIVSLAPAGVSQAHVAQQDDLDAISSIVQILGAGERPDSYSGPMELNDMLLSATAEAKQIVHERTHDVEAVAAALLEHRSLGEEDIHRLLRASELR